MTDPTLEVSSSEARLAFGERKASDSSADSGGTGGEFPLRIARVQLVDYKKMEVGLIVIGPGNHDQYKRVPLTFPGAGRRNFMGVIPDVNDLCILGYSPKESGFSRQPYIVGWLLPGTSFGYNWTTTQTHGEGEFAWTPKNEVKTEGVLGRSRQKLRQLAGGNALVSSSQGSDLFLSESVALVNRRGNELTLRDQDQALVVRSLQQFHVGAGFRVYSGIAQRDARLLPTQLFPDGTYWDSPRQRDGDENTVPQGALGASPVSPGSLDPNPIFLKTGDVRESGIQFGQEADPYSTLYRGLFIDGNGNLVGGSNPVNDGVYGGKPIRRIALTNENGVIHSDVNSYTEYRVEVAHDSDGRLPVSEQTDGFDADRVPSAPSNGNGGVTKGVGTPFTEFILGTVIGNDAFGAESSLYGQPLRAAIFDGALPAPAILSSLGFSQAEQLAFLLRVKEPSSLKDVGFMGITKGGNGVSYLSRKEERVDGAFRGSYGSARLEADASLTLSSSRGRAGDNVGVEISSTTGGVSIKGGGASTTTGAGVLIESPSSVQILSQGTLKLSASTLELSDTAQFGINTSTGVSLQTAGAMNVSGKTYSLTTLGRADYTYGGPIDGNPTNAPIKTETFVATPATGFLGGTADKYALTYGDRDELFLAGNLKRTILAGNQLVSVGAGSITHQITGAAATSLSVGGFVAYGPIVSIAATGGNLALNSSARVQITGPAGIQMTSAAGIDMTVGSGPQAGFVLTDGCVDGLTGTQFRIQGTFGVPNLRAS